MTRTPDDIKKGLQCCLSREVESCESCPYVHITSCARESAKDSLALIQQFESKLHQAVDDIRLLAHMEFACPVCAYHNHGEGTKGECVKCLTGDGFRWRGETDEDT